MIITILVLTSKILLVIRFYKWCNLIIYNLMMPYTLAGRKGIKRIISYIRFYKWYDFSQKCKWSQFVFLTSRGLCRPFIDPVRQRLWCVVFGYCWPRTGTTEEEWRDQIYPGYMLKMLFTPYLEILYIKNAVRRVFEFLKLCASQSSRKIIQ